MIFLLSLCGGLLLTSHAPRALRQPRAVTRTQLVCRQPYIRMGTEPWPKPRGGMPEPSGGWARPTDGDAAESAAPSNVTEAAADAVAPAPTQQTQTEQPPPPKQPASKPKMQPVTLTSQGAGHVNGLVLIIYTGGTLGMSKDPATGALEPKPGYLREVVSTMPEFKNADMPDTDMIEYDPLLDSSNIGPADWSYLAELVGEHYFDYDGFVIVHGTDTMAYTGAALSFMLQGLGKAVVLTGSIIPMCEVYNDARRNLIISVMFAAQLDLSEVAIFFNDVLLRANRAMKVDSSGLAAFDSPNFPPLATVGATIQTARALWRPPPAGRLRVHSKLDTKVMVVRLSPGFDDGALAALVRGAPDLRGLVLSLYGTGNGPSHKDTFLQTIRDATSRGIVVVAVSQCPKGSVSLGTYEVGRLLLELGVVSAGDMTTEACVTKLAYLAGRGLSDGALRDAMLTDLRGERSPALAAHIADVRQAAIDVEASSTSRPVRLASL